MAKKPATLAEVAKAAGVSQMTVSRALNNRQGVSRNKREDIQRIADEMGYAVSRKGPKRSAGKSRILAMVVPSVDEFVREIVAGAGRAARTAGYEMLVYSLLDSDHRPPASVLQFMQQTTAGVIALLPYEYRYLESLAAARLPVITIDQRGQHAQFPSIAADSYEGARMALQHLMDLGHRRIGFVRGDERMVSALDRLRAYTDFVARFDLARDAGLVQLGDYSERTGKEAGRRLLALTNRPSAILAANDTSAFGVMAAIREADLCIPADISVIGFDDVPAASHVHPNLTTVRQPMQQMGRSAVNTLLARIAGLEAASPQVILPAELIIRGTTARPQDV